MLSVEQAGEEPTGKNQTEVLLMTDIDKYTSIVLVEWGIVIFVVSKLLLTFVVPAATDFL